jgi:hypothetical protein
MRAGLARAMVLGVKGERKRLTVDLDPETEPITGRIAEPNGKPHEFSGYMGLIEALERLRPPFEESAADDRRVTRKDAT